MRLKVSSQKLPLSHAQTASSVFQQAAPEMHSLKTYPFCPVYDFPPSHSCYFYQQRGQLYYIRQRRHQKSSHSQGSTAVGKEPTYLNSIHLFMPTAEKTCSVYESRCDSVRIYGTYLSTSFRG